MCLGIPMRVEAMSGDGAAVCVRRSERRQVDMMLVGPQVEGTLVLVHIESAMRVLDADEAAAIDDALDAVLLALEGQAVDHLFPDLTGRTPELPPHLRR